MNIGEYLRIAMKNRYWIGISLLTFGLGVLVGWHPTFQSIRNYVVGALSLGVVIELIGFLREWYKDKKDEKAEKRKELERKLRRHSNHLVNDVLEKWFSRSKRLLQDRDFLLAQTSIAEAYYEPNSKSRIEKTLEPDHLKYYDQAFAHLVAYDLDEFWDDECVELSDNYLENNIKLARSLEEKIVKRVPAEFVEWNGLGTTPPTCYHLKNTVLSIYREGIHYMNKGELGETFKKIPEQGNFKVGATRLIAQSSDEHLVDEFIKIVNEIIVDEDLIEQLRLLDKIKEKVECSIREFEEDLNRIIDDVKQGGYILKGGCEDRCEPWVNDLVSLDESFYKKLISPT